jgi:hypothetical protein
MRRPTVAAAPISMPRAPKAATRPSEAPAAAVLAAVRAVLAAAAAPPAAEAPLVSSAGAVEARPAAAAPPAAEAPLVSSAGAVVARPAAAAAPPAAEAPPVSSAGAVEARPAAAAAPPVAEAPLVSSAGTVEARPAEVAAVSSAGSRKLPVSSAAAGGADGGKQPSYLVGDVRRLITGTMPAGHHDYRAPRRGTTPAAGAGSSRPRLHPPDVRGRGGDHLATIYQTSLSFSGDDGAGFSLRVRFPTGESPAGHGVRGALRLLRRELLGGAVSD